jgi:hypothetical protein
MSKSIKIGNTEFVLEGFVGMTKTEFKKQWKGKLGEDLDKTWKAIERARPRKKPSKSKG